jgi:hypothetical protein
VIRSMTLALGNFGRATIEELAERYSLPPEEFVARAAEYWLADRDSDRASQRLPRFQREPEERETVQLSVDLAPEAWEALQEEAQRQGVAVERVLEHAALYLVADLDSGRVATRILENQDA